MYSIIDIEGNGDAYRKERIIDIAIFRFDGRKITDQFISLVNPESQITPFVQRLTHISQKMVRTAPKFHEIAKRIIEITDGTTLVGHRIDFDYRMLRQSFKQLGYEFKINTLDTIPLAKKLIPNAESYSLPKLAKSVGIPILNAHRAESDARATLDLFKILISKDLKNEIIQKQFDESNAKTYINKIQNLTQDLPSEKGIVYFQTETGNIIFSDFTDDINRFAKRVFNSKSKRWKNIRQQCEQINYELVGNDLTAKIIIKSKGIKREDWFPFGLFHINGHYKIEKIILQKNAKPILKFRSFTQGLKALNFINSKPEFSDENQLKKTIDLKNRNEIWSFSGRTFGEKMFLILKDGTPVSYGFHEFFSQIQSASKIDKLKIDFQTSTADLENDLKLQLLKSEVEIFDLKI
ncbi:MAG: 3'-5' exonuclease [Flavobacteriaceae bacterium]|nr:3'-5' exonuclease [Flavobacteriaceae bacterium]